MALPTSVYPLHISFDNSAPAQFGGRIAKRRTRAFHHSLLHKLPNKIDILTNSPSLTTLANLLKAYPLLEALYKINYKTILAGTMSRSFPRPLQTLVCTTINVRKPFTIQRFDDLDVWLDENINDAGQPLHLESLSDPLATLHAVASIDADSKMFESTFIRSCLRKPGTRPCAVHQETPTQTERYCIQRGYWRLQLLCDLFQLRVTEISLQDPENYIEPDHLLAMKLPKWELEEVECAYHHLVKLYEETRIKTGSVQDRDSEIHRLLSHFSSPSTVSKHLDDFFVLTSSGDYSISEVFDMSREWCGVQSRSRSIWQEDMALANSPNERWNFYVRHGRWDVQICSRAYNDVARGPLSTFHDWGFCMWDQTRFNHWKIGEIGKYGHIDGHEWRDLPDGAGRSSLLPNLTYTSQA